MTRCKLNQIFIGEVASVQNYGAFIRIPGCSFQGLIHKSQVLGKYIHNQLTYLYSTIQLVCIFVILYVFIISLDKLCSYQ